MLLAITGCSPAAQSRYAPERNFSDPKALALALAAEQGDAEEVRRLMKVEGVNPDTIFSKDGYPLLFWPIFTHSPAGLKAMLDNGADPNVALPYQTLDRGVRNNPSPLKNPLQAPSVIGDSGTALKDGHPIARIQA
ncbi:hypothetical protein FHY26_002156, partial [Xanthomonas campestris]